MPDQKEDVYCSLRKESNGCLFVFNLRLIHGTFEKLKISLVEFSDHLGGSVETNFMENFWSQHSKNVQVQ